MKSVVLILLLICVVSNTESALGSGMQVLDALLAPDGGNGDRFGWSVTIDGDTAAVGAPRSGSGGVYLYQRSSGGTWGYNRKLTVPGEIETATLGRSVSLDGNLLAIGAPLSNLGPIIGARGAVYLFNRNQFGPGDWGQARRITEPGGSVLQVTLFGNSACLQDGILVVSAPTDNDNGQESGSVYVFSIHQGGLGNWGLVKKLTASDGQAGDHFGASIALDGDYLIVGAPEEDAGGFSNAGAAYVFRKHLGGANNWGQQAKLTARAVVPQEDRFGTAVAIEGNLAVVGAPRDGGSANNNSGQVRIFSKDQGGVNNWGLTKRLLASDSAALDLFGSSLSLSGGVLAVGAPTKESDIGTVGAGAAYLYGMDEGRGWGEIGKLEKWNIGKDSLFGWSVALDGATLVTGAVEDALGSFLKTGSAFALRVQVPQAPPENLIIDGGFNTQPLGSGLPAALGNWRVNDKLQIVPPAITQNVFPKDGIRMIRFINTGATAGVGINSDVYQLVDLSAYAARISSGTVSANVTCHVNRVTGDSDTDSRFAAQLLGYSGSAANFPANFGSPNSAATGMLDSDSDQATWQRMQTQLTLSPGTSYVALRFAALENVNNDITGVEFEGHYGDQVGLSLSATPEVPEITKFELTGACDIRIRFTTVPGFHYFLQKSRDLEKWTTISWGMPGSGGATTVVRPGGMGGIYYRVGVRW